MVRSDVSKSRGREDATGLAVKGSLRFLDDGEVFGSGEDGVANSSGG